MVNKIEKIDFIDEEQIVNILESNKDKDVEEIERIIEKARQAKGITIEEAAALLNNSNPQIEEKLFEAAREIKERIYGNRIVMFAPLYVSNYCVNRCTYCGYKCTSRIERRRLTDDEIRRKFKQFRIWAIRELPWRRGGR